jgi:phage gp29-like protein
MQQKILLMWATFLDGQSQPKVIVYGESKTEADANAKAIATLRGSGVLGLKRDASASDTAKLFETLDVSGKGADQFVEMIRWLDSEMTRSVMAGFLDLSTAASQGIGSYALSNDQSSLFLTSRQAAAKELSATVTDQIIRPLVRVNFGPDAAIPRLVFEKMNRDTTDKAMQMLQQLGSSQAMNVPPGFIDLLVERVAQHLDLSDEKVEEMLEERAKQRRLAAEQAGRPPEESEAPQGQLTDTVNAGLDVLREHQRERQ